MRWNISLRSLLAVLLLSLSVTTNGQTLGAPKSMSAGPVSGKPKDVIQIDATDLRKLLKPNGKPLLVNFWATWCDPCREEFPDLVRFDHEYRGQIDFITVSLDELSEIKRDVPKFLVEMKAEMPAYLLKTADESAAIAMIASDWRGGLPFTLLFDPSGKMTYFRQGKVFPAVLRTELEKVLSATQATELPSVSQ